MSSKQKWIIGIAIACIGLFFTQTININDDAFDLLPGTAVRGDLELLDNLGLINRVIISLTLEKDEEPGGIDTLKKSGLALGKKLDSSRFFTNVMYHLPEKFELQTFQNFQPLLPLLLDDHDLSLLKPLTESSAIARSLRDNFNLLNSPAGYGLKHQIQRDPLKVSSIFLNKLQYLKAEYSVEVEDGLFLSKDKKSCLVIAESTLKLTDSDSAAFINKELGEIFKSSLLQGVRPVIIGSLPHTLANATSVKHDLQTLLPIATLLLLFLMLITLRHVRAILVLAIPFLAAPSAIAITGLIYGKVSALALGFGVVLLGIAMDFAIHLYLGLVNSSENDTFLKTIRKPILLATLTTASVFIVLLFSEIPSHRQMATLALSGIILAVLYSWYLIPLVVRHKYLTLPLAIRFSEFFQIQPNLLTRRLILLGWFFLVVFGAISWPGLKYNGNLQTLDAPSPSVKKDESFFKRTWGEKGDQVYFVAKGKNLDMALQYNYSIFKELQKIDGLSFQSIAPILPSLADQTANLAGWQKFWQMIGNDFHSTFKTTATELGFSEKAFAPFFSSLVNPPRPVAMFQQLPDNLKTLVGAMIRTPNQQRDSGTERNYLITTTVSTNNDLYPRLLELEKHQQNITLLANKKWRDQVEKLLRNEIVTLSLAAAAIIALITFISFRSIRVAAAVLAPVISALAAMAIFSSITARELNMMHLLMGIMVIGLAVDYGIFTVCSQQKGQHETSPLAVSLCAMSSLVGFGVLSFAHHPALNALGITVLVGIGTAWPTAILVSPAIMMIGKKADHTR